MLNNLTDSEQMVLYNTITKCFPRGHVSGLSTLCQDNEVVELELYSSTMPLEW